MEVLTEKDVDALLEKHPKWSYDTPTRELRRIVGFDSYTQAVAFVNSVAELAEQHSHHPRITLEYGKVGVSMNTHDAGDVLTDRDSKLAIAIDELLE